MTTVIEENGFVNAEQKEIDAEKYLNDSTEERAILPGVEKPVEKSEAHNLSENKEDIAEPFGNAPRAEHSADEERQDEDSSDELDEPNRKRKPPTVDYIYIKRRNQYGKLVVYDYRRDGNIAYKWTGEYWKECDENTIKGEIAEWLKNNHPADFNLSSLRSIYSMFINSVKEFASKQINGIIIPTKGHWLVVDEKSGDITAVAPQKWQPIKYQINLLVPAEGPYTLPKIDAKDSLFKQFITSSLPVESVRAVVQEFAGLSLTNTCRKGKINFWVGKGANGKSVLAEILSSLHGNPVAVNISDIGQYNSHLVGASLIFATETTKKGFDQEFLKQAVTGDKVEVRAIYGKKQNAVLTAKWILIMNELPLISDFTDGLFRRIQIINWTQQFKGKDVIEDLAKKIIKKEKLQVLVWCLEGLQRMIRDEWNFSECKEMEQATHDWMNSADKVRLFVSEKNYGYSSDKQISTQKMKIFESFNKWADANRFEQMSSTGFWARMNNIFPELKADPNAKKNGERIVYLYIKPSNV